MTKEPTCYCVIIVISSDLFIAYRFVKEFSNKKKCTPITAAIGTQNVSIKLFINCQHVVVVSLLLPSSVCFWHLEGDTPSFNAPLMHL